MDIQRNLIRVVLISFLIMIPLVNAGEEFAGIGDRVEITVKRANPINSLVVTLREDLFLKSNLRKGYDYLINVSDKMAIISQNTINTIIQEPPVASGGILTTLLAGFFLIILFGGLGFGGVLVYRRFFRGKGGEIIKDNYMAVEKKAYIEISPEIKKELLKYKEKEWTWDYFMTEVIKLIEEDIQSGKGGSQNETNTRRRS